VGFDISSVEYNWEKLAQDDPLWSILTVEEKKGRRWDIEEFLATGIKDVANITSRCTELGLEFSGHKAMDFGCGIGRLSSAMLGYVDKVVGVDISTSMIDLGRKIHAGKPIEFVLNKKDDLDQFSDSEFDLVFTLITLQHMPPEFEEKYILEFLRILRPGGLLIFQLPGRSFTPESMLAPKGPLRRAIAKLLPGHFLERYRHFRESAPRMDMFGMPPEKIEGLMTDNGAQLVACDELEPVAEGFPNYRYFITKDNG
jgi:ubiquinone/menaquinone biosynthesis C-methylase UbiE